MIPCHHSRGIQRIVLHWTSTWIRRLYRLFSIYQSGNQAKKQILKNNCLSTFLDLLGNFPVYEVAFVTIKSTPPVIPV
jgi:hypothetical protein